MKVFPLKSLENLWRICENEHFVCFRLESKLSALGEKKRSLKNQLEDLRREMSDKDLTSQDDKIEALVDLYEKKNQELEEREMEVRYRLQMLENTMPALMMWNIWKMMLTMQGTSGPSNMPMGTAPSMPLMSDMGVREDEFEANPEFNKEEELVVKLKQLETKLNTQNKILADSKATEDSLRIKLQQLENWMTGGNAPPLTTKDLDTDVEMFEKLSKMAKDRMDMDRRIKDLELKERVFKETLEQADNMIAQLETQFKSQIHEKEQELQDVSVRLRDSELRLRTAEKTNSQTMLMQDRITLLEGAVEKLKKTLATRDREKERLEEEYNRLIKDVELSGEELDTMKKELTDAKRKIEASKKSGKHLEDELTKAEFDREAAYTAHKGEVKHQQPNQTVYTDWQGKPHELTVHKQPIALLSTLSSVSVVHIFVYLFMALLVLKRSTTGS